MRLLRKMHSRAKSRSCDNYLSIKVQAPNSVCLYGFRFFVFVVFNTFFSVTSVNVASRLRVCGVPVPACPVVKIQQVDFLECGEDAPHSSHFRHYLFLFSPRLSLRCQRKALSCSQRLFFCVSVLV